MEAAEKGCLDPIGDPFLRFAREKSGTPSVLLTNSNNRIICGRQPGAVATKRVKIHVLQILAPLFMWIAILNTVS